MVDATTSRASRLSLASLPALATPVRRPNYAPEKVRIGIVHFGPGAFHRAHQAVYVDDVLRDSPDWAISAVSLHSTLVQEELEPQDGLYTVAILGTPVQLRLIGAIREVLCAPREPERVLERLADPAVRLATLTVTEKGYALAADGVDFSNPEIAHDVATPEAPRSAIGYLVAGLGMRRRRGIPPYTVLSCDNLMENGRHLRRAAVAFAYRIDPDLADWIAASVAFPCSMVDSITPATDDALRAYVAAESGYVDAGPVQREPYAQWVIENNFCNDRPPLERAGAVFSNDVAGYERAKLRLLNGAHSALAYLGSLLGLDTVSDAMREPALGGYAERLMRESIATVTLMPRDLAVGEYIDSILRRLRNGSIHHHLSQIAWDGSQKLPVRLFGTLRDALAAGHSIRPLCLAVAAWMQFVRLQSHLGIPLNDPLDRILSAMGRACQGDARTDVGVFLTLDRVFAPLSHDARFSEALRDAYHALGDATPAAVLRALAAC